VDAALLAVGPVTPTSEPIEERFRARVNRQGPDDCWPWTGAKSSYGYGQFWTGKSQILAHRYAYQLANGVIPDGLTIDHVCHNNSGCSGGMCQHRLCVNPRHLEAVDLVANCRRSHLDNSAKTHCPAGHPYEEGNIYRRTKQPARRDCRTCAIERQRRTYRPRKRKPPPLKPCGTRAGYRQHLRRGETTCADCRAANAERERLAKEKRAGGREVAWCGWPERKPA
jgi:hypothetical protein